MNDLTRIKNNDKASFVQSAEAREIVSVCNLKKHFRIKKNSVLYAVDGISFSIREGETLGLVGESGCGKSTVGNLIIGLLDKTDGEIRFENEDVANLSKEESYLMKRKMQMIFQDPYSSLNPRKSIRTVLAEPLKLHHLASGMELERRIRELIQLVGLEEYVLNCYPYELDGGKRQLVGIARALSLDPRFIICDEPVSALDVSVQATIINFLMRMQQEHKLSYLFISHDLSVVRHISNRVAVMYLGKIVEIAETDQIFGEALHPYTQALLSAVPKVDFGDRGNRIILKGDVSSPINPKENSCRFAQRCWMVGERCTQESPELVEVSAGHCVACHYYQESQKRMEQLNRIQGNK